MQPPILEIAPHLRAEGRRLLSRPPQHPREERQRHGLHPPDPRRLRPHAQLLQLRVPHPLVDGPRVALDHYVLEPGGLHHGPEPGGDGDGPLDGVGGLDEEVGPPRDGRLGGNGVVVAANWEAVVLDLDGAARREVPCRRGLARRQ